MYFQYSQGEDHLCVRLEPLHAFRILKYFASLRYLCAYFFTDNNHTTGVLWLNYNLPYPINLQNLLTYYHPHTSSHTLSSNTASCFQSPLLTSPTLPTIVRITHRDSYTLRYIQKFHPRQLDVMTTWRKEKKHPSSIPSPSVAPETPQAVHLRAENHRAPISNSNIIFFFYSCSLSPSISPPTASSWRVGWRTRDIAADPR